MHDKMAISAYISEKSRKGPVFNPICTSLLPTLKEWGERVFCSPS